MDKKTKEPLIHITKRKMIPKKQEWAIRLGGILAALIFCAIITTITTHLNPLAVYAKMFEGSFGSPRKMWALLKELASLLLIAVALAATFKMKFWNLGGGGQVMAGVLATTAVMITMTGKLPSVAIICLSFIAALAAGALWAFIPAFCRAKWNTSETLFTLMMNYVATQIVAYFIIIWENPKGAGKIGVINQTSHIGWLPTLANNPYMLIVIVSVIVTIFMYIYLKYTKHGYELSVVGESENTARYVGLNVSKVIIRTLVLCGLICGLTGWLLVAGTDHTMTTTIEGGKGFLGVMVAWLAHFNPIGMILSGLLMVFMAKGGSEISMAFGLNRSYGDILTGIILFFVIGSEFFINYQLHFRKSHRKEAADV